MSHNDMMMRASLLCGLSFHERVGTIYGEALGQFCKHENTVTSKLSTKVVVFVFMCQIMKNMMVLDISLTIYDGTGQDVT